MAITIPLSLSSSHTLIPHTRGLKAPKVQGSKWRAVVVASRAAMASEEEDGALSRREVTVSTVLASLSFVLRFWKASCMQLQRRWWDSVTIKQHRLSHQAGELSEVS